jgi:hypothetical protein
MRRAESGQAAAIELLSASGAWFGILKDRMATCSICKQASKVLRLHKCALCYKLVCEKCAVRRYAQKFCSAPCAKAFFFSSEEYFE